MITTIQTDKPLKILLYHREMLLNMNFGLKKTLCEKITCQKAAALKTFEFSPLGKDLKE